MAIKVKKTIPEGSKTDTFKLTTGSVGVTNGSYGVEYSASKTIDYGAPVKYVTVMPKTVYYKISGNTVKYTFTSSSANSSTTVTATANYGGTSEITLTDVKLSSGTVNYVKANNTYVWTRPASFTMQLPWSYFSAWTLSRTSSLNPDVAAGAVTSRSSSSMTSGTSTYSVNGLKYGDNLKLTYTLKEGGSVNISNNYTCTVDPTFSISNTGATQSSTLPSPTVTLGSEDKNTLKLTVTNNSGANVKIRIYKGTCQVDKGSWSGGKQSVDTVYEDGTAISTSMSPGSLVGSQTGTYTLYLGNNGKKDWDTIYACIYVYVELESAGSTMYASGAKSATITATYGTYYSSGGGGGGGGGGAYGS
jgi:hypothetical protein